MARAPTAGNVIGRCGSAKRPSASAIANPGAHLVRDAFQGAFELAAVLTNDTDLVEPARIVTQELNLPVTLLTPTVRPAAPLMAAATGVRHVQPYIGPCQLPDTLPVPGKRPITRPAGW